MYTSSGNKTNYIAITTSGWVDLHVSVDLNEYIYLNVLGQISFSSQHMAKYPFSDVVYCLYSYHFLKFYFNSLNSMILVKVTQGKLYCVEYICHLVILLS